MAKKKTPQKKEKFYENEKIVVPLAISLPILTFLILWYIATPETIPEQRLVYAETMDFYWTDALFQTLLIWIPIIGFFFGWVDNESVGSGIATAIGLFIGTLIGGGILKFLIEMALTATMS